MFFVVLFVLGFAVFMLGSSPEFSDEEEAQLTLAHGDLEAFLPTLEDLSVLPMDLYDCTERSLGTVGFDYDVGDGGELKGIDVVESEGEFAERSFCDEYSGSIAVSAVVSLPANKPTLNHWLAGDEELAKGTAEGLETKAEAFLASADWDGRLIESAWIPGGDTLGDVSHASYYLISYDGLRGVYYDYDIIRGVIALSMLFTFDDASHLRDDTYTVAERVDDRVRDRLATAGVESGDPYVETQN